MCHDTQGDKDAERDYNTEGCDIYVAEDGKDSERRREPRAAAGARAMMTTRRIAAPSDKRQGVQFREG